VKRIVVLRLCPDCGAEVSYVGTGRIPLCRECRSCRVEACNRPKHSKGYCLLHHKRMLRTGTLETRKTPDGTPIWKRLLRHTMFDKGCWLWLGATNHAGYGIIGYEGKSRLVHRLVYTGLYGPTDLILHHTCERPTCYSPLHLIPVTRLEHLRIHYGGLPCPSR
jgi:hypothetical protein